MSKAKEITSEVASVSLKDESVQSLLEKNLKWSQLIYEQNRKIKRRLTLMAVGNYLRLFMILAPLILAVIYLPPLIEKLLATYGGLLGNVTGGGGSGAPAIFGGGLPLQDILSQIKPEQIQALLKSLPQQ